MILHIHLYCSIMAYSLLHRCKRGVSALIQVLRWAVFDLRSTYLAPPPLAASGGIARRSQQARSPAPPRLLRPCLFMCSAPLCPRGLDSVWHVPWANRTKRLENWGSRGDSVGLPPENNIWSQLVAYHRICGEDETVATDNWGSSSLSLSPLLFFYSITPPFSFLLFVLSFAYFCRTVLPSLRCRCACLSVAPCSSL